MLRILSALTFILLTACTGAPTPAVDDLPRSTADVGALSPEVQSYPATPSPEVSTPTPTEPIRNTGLDTAKVGQFVTPQTTSDAPDIRAATPQPTFVTVQPNSSSRAVTDASSAVTPPSSEPVPPVAPEARVTNDDRAYRQAPLFTLPNAAGGVVSLGTYLGEGNVVLIFYRGFW